MAGYCATNCIALCQRERAVLDAERERAVLDSLALCSARASLVRSVSCSCRVRAARSSAHGSAQWSLVRLSRRCPCSLVLVHAWSTHLRMLQAWHMRALVQT